jgi:hypothetical protein
MIYDSDLVDIANRVIPYMNTYKNAPNYANVINTTGDMEQDISCDLNH